jgi:hypothetical protein
MVKDSSEPFICWLQPRIKKIEGDVPILVIILCFPLYDALNPIGYRTVHQFPSFMEINV